MRLKALARLAIVLSILVGGFLAAAPQAQATTYTQTRYLTDLRVLISGMTSLWLGSEYMPPDTPDYFESQSTLTGSKIASWSMQVYIQSWDGGNITELTSGAYSLFSRTTNGEGIQTKTWDCPGSVIKRNDTIYIEIRYSFIGGPTNLLYPSPTTGNAVESSSIWISESQGAIQLLNSTWTISLYTYRNYPGSGKTTGRLYFNNATYASKIENIQYDDGAIEEAANMLPVGFLLGAMIAIPIGLLIAKKH